MLLVLPLSDWNSSERGEEVWTKSQSDLRTRGQRYARSLLLNYVDRGLRRTLVLPAH